MLTKLSLKNSSIVVLLTLLVILAGAFAIPRLGIEFLPEIAPPVVSIVTVYPNASPEAVAHDVTKPIEEAVSSVPSLEKLRSVSNENVSIIIAEFSYGTDMDKTEQRIVQEVNKIKGDLPDSIVEPRIRRFNMNDAPVISLSVTSKGGQSETSRIARDVIKPEIENIPGVASVDINGLAEKRFEVTLNPDKLKDNKLSSMQIVQALKANNLTMPGGVLDIGTKSIPIQTISRIKTKADLENLIISVSVDDEKLKELQTDALKNSQSALMKAQASMLKKILGAQQKAIMQQMQEMLKGISSGKIGIPPGMNMPGGSLPEAIPRGSIPGTLPGGNQPGTVPGGTMPGYPSEGSQTSTAPSTTQPGEQPTENKTSLKIGSNQKSNSNQGSNSKFASYEGSGSGSTSSLLVSSSSMDSFGSMGGGLAGSSSAGSLSMLSMGGSSSNSDIPIKIVRLKDVAQVSEAYDFGSSIYRMNKKPSIGIDIRKGSRQNTVAVADAVIAKIPELERKAGSGTDIIVTNNQAEYIKNAINGMVREGLLGALFAVLVIFFFLRNLRYTLVSAISIPLSVIIGLVFLYVANISLNLFTLGGITIAIGRVVDDSIVVLENIFRRMQTIDEKRLTNIIIGTGEVARAITASTITTVAVFLPLGFVKGFVGELFRPFAYTVTLTLLASLLVAVTIVPLLASKLAPSKGAGHAGQDTFLKRIYISMLKWSLRRKTFVIVVSLMLLAVSLALIPSIPKNFISQSNTGTFTISIEMPVGTSLSTTSDVASKIEDILTKDERIESLRTVIGSSQGSFASGGGSDTGSIFVKVKKDYKDDKARVVEDVRKRVTNIDHSAKIAVSGAEQVAGMSNTIEVNLSANSYNDLKAANAVLMNALSKVKEISNVKSNLSESKSELWVEVNEVEAMKQGLTAIQVAAAVRGAVNGESATTIESGGSSIDVIVRLDKNRVKDRDTLASLTLLSPMGKVIRLDSIAKVGMANGPVNITRINQERSATLTMEPVIKNTGAASRAVKDAVKDTKLPAGASAHVGGVTTMMEEGFSSMGMALVVAIVLVYIVMVGTFRSLLHPFTMMFSLPLAVIGAFIALFITGRELGMPSMIGLLMLVGIVVTNAIVLLDLVQQLRAKGYAAYEAIIQAGSTRMRPILMTALATILALVPMAAGRTEGGIISAPLATVVIGGLLTSTFLTLVVIPVLYLTFDSLRNRFGIADTSFAESSEIA
ncbi:MAG: efflux RND transporter permease subunit [Actinomycetota bacterium]